MRSPFTRVVRRSVRAGQNLVSQIVVSVAAAVCVGFITSAYLEEKSASPELATAQSVEQATLDAAPKSPIRIVGDTSTNRTGQPARPLQPSAAPLVRNAAEATPSTAARPVGATAETSLPPLPSETIADLPVHDATLPPIGAEIFPGVPAESMLAESLRDPAGQAPDRRRFLGLPLPYFVPTASDLVQSASAAGERIVAIVDRR